MRERPSALRVGAVLSAAVLGGAYVWFRAAQARDRHELPAIAEASATQPMKSSSTTLMHPCLSYNYRDPYPDANAIGAGFKLNNSISAEFAVGADVKAGMIDLIPNEQPSTQPTNSK